MLPSPSLSSCFSFFKSFFISNHLKFGSHFTSWHSSSSYSLAKICISFYTTNGFKRLTLLLPSYYCGQSLRFVRSLPFVELFFFLSLRASLLITALLLITFLVHEILFLYMSTILVPILILLVLLNFAVFIMPYLLKTALT